MHKPIAKNATKYEAALRLCAAVLLHPHGHMQALGAASQYQAIRAICRANRLLLAEGRKGICFQPARTRVEQQREDGKAVYVMRLFVRHVPEGVSAQADEEASRQAMRATRRNLPAAGEARAEQHLAKGLRAQLRKGSTRPAAVAFMGAPNGAFALAVLSLVRRHLVPEGHDAVVVAHTELVASEAEFDAMKGRVVFYLHGVPPRKTDEKRLQGAQQKRAQEREPRRQRSGRSSAVAMSEETRAMLQQQLQLLVESLQSLVEREVATQDAGVAKPSLGAEGERLLGQVKAILPQLLTRETLQEMLGKAEGKERQELEQALKSLQQRTRRSR